MLGLKALAQLLGPFPVLFVLAALVAAFEVAALADFVAQSLPFGAVPEGLKADLVAQLANLDLGVAAVEDLSLDGDAAVENVEILFDPLQGGLADRDIALVEMTGVKYHADQITTARALPALERAKKNGFDVTAGVSIHHLTLNELDVADYRTFFKVKPPLRSEDDRQAVVEAVKSGLIDVIGSFHTPQDEESKRLPFEEAASGAVGLETMLPVLMRLYHSGDLDLPTLFRALSLNPAKRMGLECGRLTKGAPADLVLFDPDKPIVLDRFKLLSKSKNTPFDGARLQGKVLETFVSGTSVYRST